ncbi:MAG: NAD(P)(+) transhydrogenase (Re/Si-specific) subunit alpha [Halobacteriovoraceae bacterium]|nr:NAD(P)(+) transhydrogenase (Re/Si-specific) subunit alpha [Halobacteriovoraceae bacterium]
MKIVIPKETHPGETRVALIPEGAKDLVDKGIQVSIQKDAGLNANFQDEDYSKVGATIFSDLDSEISSGDILARVRKPEFEKEDLSKLKDKFHISFLDPFRSKETVLKFKESEASSISLEMIPRSTIAQKMDALSSQTNLAGYVAVIEAAGELGKILPMMMTPAGTLHPAKVFVIGAGVAGLQAIATAKRLGAKVEAFDTRPVVEEQVRSLGASFVKVDLGETGQTKDGYAKALTEEQLEKQRQTMAKHCAKSDIVITTAQVFGRPAPRIITADMVAKMKPGSVIVDLAVETGGNVEGSKLNEKVEKDGVFILGHGNLPGMVPQHASQMFSSNLVSFLNEFYDKEKKIISFNTEDEILKSCLITHKGEVVHRKIKEALGV